jgi:hypothetical protein
MRKNRPLPDRPPAFTGDHDAAAEWLFPHNEQSLAEDESGTANHDGYAA